MMVNMSVRCIDKSICENCPELDLSIDQVQIGDMEFETTTINNISCKHYNKCSRLLRFLNENKDDIKYIGREGD